MTKKKNLNKPVINLPAFCNNESTNENNEWHDYRANSDTHDTCGNQTKNKNKA